MDTDTNATSRRETRCDRLRLRQPARNFTKEPAFRPPVRIEDQHVSSGSRETGPIALRFRPRAFAPLLIRPSTVGKRLSLEFLGARRAPGSGTEGTHPPPEAQRDAATGTELPRWQLPDSITHSSRSAGNSHGGGYARRRPVIHPDEPHPGGFDRPSARPASDATRQVVCTSQLCCSARTPHRPRTSSRRLRPLFDSSELSRRRHGDPALGRAQGPRDASFGRPQVQAKQRGRKTCGDL